MLLNLFIRLTPIINWLLTSNKIKIMSKYIAFIITFLALNENKIMR